MPPRHILALLPRRHKCSCLSSALLLRPLLIALSVGLCQIMEYNEVVAHHVCFFSALFSWNAISWHDPQQHPLRSRSSRPDRLPPLFMHFCRPSAWLPHYVCLAAVRHGSARFNCATRGRGGIPLAGLWSIAKLGHAMHAFFCFVFLEHSSLCVGRAALVAVQSCMRLLSESAFLPSRS